MPLTNAHCLNARTESRRYKIADSRGLFLHVMPNGSKYWRLRYRYGGKEKCLALGVYPAVSLADARRKRDEALAQLDGNIDPAVARQAERAQAILATETTFEPIAREWYELRKGGWSKRHAFNVLRRLELDVLPDLGKRPIAAITPPEVLACLRKMESRGAMELARRARQTCGQIFRYAIVTERATRNPAQNLEDAMKSFKRGHFASIESDELPEFLATLERNDVRLYMPTRMAVRLMLLTFVRTHELVAAKWAEMRLEEGEWLVPRDRMKMDRTAHIVPLARQAVALLRELRKLTGWSEWVFPNQVSAKIHMSNCTVLAALKRMGYKGRMTGHGFRALAMSTIKEKLGYRHEVVDRQLAHAPRNKVDAAYDRAAFLPERRKMMQEWADYLDQLRVARDRNSSDLVPTRATPSHDGRHARMFS